MSKTIDMDSIGAYGKDAKDGQVEYPIYRKSKRDGVVVKFTALMGGEVVVSSGDRAVGEYHEDWLPHTIVRIWEDWT